MGFLLLLAGGYAAGTAYLNSAAFRHKLLHQANAAMDGRLTIESHYLALHDARLEISGVRLTDSEGQLLAEINQLRLQLVWPALLRRTIHIKTLVVEDARFHLSYDPADQLRIVKAKAPSDPPDHDKKNKKMWAWRIDDLRLNQGAVDFKRPAKKWTGQLNGIDVTARFDSAQPDGDIQITTSPIRLQQSEAAYELPPLNLSAAVNVSQTITLTVKTPKSTLDARGRLDRKPAEPFLDMDCDLNLDPSEFQAWLPAKISFKDRISTHVTAKGRLDDPTVTIHAALSKATVMGLPIGQLEADLGMHQRNIAIKAVRSSSDWGDLDLTGYVDLASVLDGIFNVNNAQWENLSYGLKLEGNDLQPGRLGLFRFPPGGTFQLESEFTGSGLASDASQGKAHIKLQGSGMTPRDGGPDVSGGLTAELQRKGAAIDLNRLQAAVGSTDIEGTARINVSDRRIEHAKARLQSARLNELGALFGIQLPSGSGNLNFQCQGPIQRPTAKIALFAREMSMGKWPIGQFLADARFNDHGVLNISRWVLKNQGSLVEGNGQLTLLDADGQVRTDPGVLLKVGFQHLAPADFGLAESAGSHFTGRMNLEGSLKHLTGQAVLDESAIHWGGFDGRVQAEAQWHDGHLVIPDLKLFKAASQVHVKGSATWRRSGEDQWSATPQVEARIQGRDIRIQDFFPDDGGVLTLEGSVSGPTSDLKGLFELSGTDLDIGGQTFKSLMIKGRSSSDKIYWDTLVLAVKKDQQLTSQGWYAFDRRFSLSMAGENIGLRHVAALQRAYPVEGRLGLRLKATGSIDTPQLDADLIIHDPYLNDQPWDDFQMTAQMQGRRLKLAADLNFDLTADYRIDNGDFNLEADFDRSDMSPYLALWAGADWAGMLSGRLRAKGNRHQPNQIQADLALNETELSYQKRSVISVQQLKARLEDGQLELPSTRMELLNNGYIDLTAAGRLPTDLSISAQGLLPLAALTPFVKSLEEPRGEVTFKTGAQGSLDDIQWQAKLDFNNTGFEIPGLNQQVESLKGRLEITPGRILVEDLSGRMDGGRFTLNGQMPLEQWRPIGGQLILNAHALPLQWPDTMDVVVSGDLTFKGAEETPTLSGQLVLLEGSYYKDVKLNLLSAVTQTKRAVPIASSYSVPGKLGRTALNVAVTHRYPLLVDNNLANLQIAPDLKISGTLARPILSGRAQVKEGEVIFRRKSFEVKRGVVDFINPYKIEPNLDIVAEADIRQWRVSLSLSGTPDQLVFKLNSNPAESENDILSLILLGRTGSELTKGEGGSKQTTRQMLASLVATAWGEDVKKHSRIDILEVETGTGEDEESADRVQLTVGKKLSRRLTVKYEVESGQEELVQRAISEYQFLEHLLASGFQDSKGGYGGELVFRVEF
jgi:translocation and assembly module TamB